MTVTDRFEIPPEMRAFAEKSVEQARQAFDGFISAATSRRQRVRGPGRDRPQGRQGCHREGDHFRPEQHRDLVRLRAKAGAGARNVEDVLKLQADYIKTQMQALTEQAKELSESTTKAARDATKSKH